MLIVGLPVASLTPFTAVGLGGAAATPPQEAQVPTQRMAAARVERRVTASRKFTSAPSIAQAMQVFPWNRVGTPPSTARI